MKALVEKKRKRGRQNGKTKFVKLMMRIIQRLSWLEGASVSESFKEFREVSVAGESSNIIGCGK